MILTYKDTITTGLAVITGAFTYLLVTGYKFSLITGYRLGTLVLLILGIMMCANSGTGPITNWTNSWILVASTLGVIALIAAVLGLITGTKEAFLVLAGTILVLWGLTTLHHILE